jgi:hypothetical protein
MRRHQRLDKLMFWLSSFGSQASSRANPSCLIREPSSNASLARYKIKTSRVELLTSRVERVIEPRVFRPALPGTAVASNILGTSCECQTFYFYLNLNLQSDNKDQQHLRHGNLANS